MVKKPKNKSTNKFNTFNTDIDKFHTSIHWDPGRLFGIFCRTGNLDLVRVLLPNNRSYINYGLLLASQYNHLEMVQYLINNGADPNHVEGRPLLMAVECQYIEIVQFLLKQNINEKYIDSILKKSNNNLITNMLLNYLQNDNNCCICMDRPKNCKLLLCNHEFCYDCIKEVSRIKCPKRNIIIKKCPICREEFIDNHIIKNEQTVPSEKQEFEYIETINHLLEKGADINLSNDQNVTSTPWKHNGESSTGANIYYGFYSLKQLNIKFPELKEIEKDGKWFYGCKIKVGDANYDLTSHRQFLSFISKDLAFYVF